MTFGSLPRNRFTPPRPTRGGNMGFFQKPKEAPLTGKVQNMKAAQGEERLARTLEKGIRKGLVREHRFRWTTLKRGTVGYKELDELIFLTNGRILAVSIKGKAFVHASGAAKEQDKLNEVLILAKLREYGYDVRAVETVFDTELETQESADKVGRKLGAYR